MNPIAWFAKHSVAANLMMVMIIAGGAIAIVGLPFGPEELRGGAIRQVHARVALLDQTVELRPDASGLGDLDEERRRELALSRNQLVVDVELVLDPCRVSNALDEEHLEDLEAERLPVLEEQRDVISHRHPARAFVGDDGAAVVGAQARVGLEVDEVFSLQPSHSAPIP